MRGSAYFRQSFPKKIVCSLALYEFLTLTLDDLEVAVCGGFRRSGGNLCLIKPGGFCNFAQLNRPALLDRLPDGIRGFVEEDFVGHGGAESNEKRTCSRRGVAGGGSRRFRWRQFTT